MKTIALILAAGRGKRMASDIPKSYLPLKGKPILAHTIARFTNHPRIDHVAVMIHPDDKKDFQDLNLSHPKLLPPIHGGILRQDSVAIGLEALAAHQPQYILIHDAARPWFEARLIDDLLTALNTHDAAFPALPVSETLRRGEALEIIPRDGMMICQTPQAFHFDKIRNAHQTIRQEVTDDITLAQADGQRVTSIPGDPHNIKVTYPQDIRQMESYMHNDIRVGTGTDVHAFTAGDHLWLCGVKIPHTHKLEGHSDADVALHALTDAILGTIGAGDIGIHFPCDDEKWRNVASHIFLQKALDLLTEKGGVITNMDLTILCEAPRILPHREAMLANLQKLTGLDPDRINLKATTTEKLGFLGRKEGMMAQATVTVRLA